MIQGHQLFMISLKVLLKNKQGQYLLLKTPFNTTYWKGKYDLPGGRINNNEIKISFHRLIDREIKEEVGFKVKYRLRKDPVALSKHQFKDSRCILYILFEAKYLSGKIKISPEHTEFRWQKINRKNSKKYFHPKFVAMYKNYLDWNK